MDEDLLKSIVGGVKKDEHEVQVDDDLDLDLMVHDEDVHEEVALNPSGEYRDTDTFDSRIVDMLSGELELVHSSSSTAGVQMVMIGEIHEVQGSDHKSRDSGKSHMEALMGQ